MEKNKILIADDAEMNRAILRYIFEEQFEILEAEDGQQAMDIIEEQKDEIAILFLDLMMPNKNGMDVLEFMNEKGYIEFLPVIMITGEATDFSDEKAYDYGVMDIIYKPFAPRVVMRRTRNILELYERRQDLEKQLEERTKEVIESRNRLEHNSDFLINALSSVAEFRSMQSEQHIRRIRYFTRIMLNCLMKYHPEYNLTKEQIDLIVRASSVHDIGKILVPDSILLKPDKLTAAEFYEVKKHTTYGAEILEQMGYDNEFYRYCYDICKYHHERWDGGGYPEHLKGDDIPIWAQIVSLVDVYDALVSERVYKNAYTFDEAICMIKNGECGVFSPIILECFDYVKFDFFQADEILGNLSFISQ